MKNTNSCPKDSINFSSRESLLTANSELITQLRDRLKAKRFRPQNGDNIKLAYIRVYIQALQVQNAIMKDSEIEELKVEIEELKEAIKCPSHR
jgi:hypothetical protein